MAQPVIYSTPPIAGRPPYATDEPDSVYQQQPQQTRRIRQPPPENLNDRTSAYNMYDQYLDGANAPKSTNPFDDPKVRSPPQPIPLAAPRPGYAAPVAALNLSRPDAIATPDSRVRSPTTPEMSQAFPKPLTLVERQASPASPHFPHTPHELQPPMTPIAPAFIRPASAASTQRDVQFSPTTPILRGEKEDAFLPRRGQGEEFWRRFSMVAKDESTKRGKQSAWLRKTSSGITRYVRWVWVIGISLLIIICCAVAFGVYKTHHSSSSSDSSVVTAIGGSAEESGSSNTVTAEEKAGTSTFSGVTPTLTVARRSIDIKPTDTPTVPISPAALPVLPGADTDVPSYVGTNGSTHAHRAVPPLHRRYKRSYVNRSSLD
ncbi:hypothetical protein DAEQUDRAFT_732405 [Daedalea quercina L-15889]|uniref:Transmembrane protein n=1 Tax=Daedalea quercina L-15889 TaxID=1314783 RepID=A0A165LN07_9APHY|nr:hypothetical protein DAEQUDRAFT_732405 [Daedalea quercina L-15889]